MRNALIHIVLLAVCLSTATACRTVRPEAGLPPSVFEGPMPRITSNDRGFWFLISEDETEFKPFAELRSGDRSEIFYAVPKGERTVRLLPVSPFAYPMLDALRDSTVEVRWLDTPNGAGAEFTDPIGWTTDGRTVEWAGEPPEDGTPVALLAGTSPADLKLSKWLLGTATLQGGRLTNVVKGEGVEGPFVVVPDGHSGASEFEIRTKNASFTGLPGMNVATTDVAIPAGTPTRFSWRPPAAESEGDLLIARHGSGPLAMAANPVVVNGLALAVTDEPIGTSSKGVKHLARAYQALSNEQYLGASFWFARARPTTSRGNAYAGALRALELIAAAGYVDWMRQAVLVGADGLDADAALYLARGHFLSGDYSRADDFATRAIERFGGWVRPGSNIGAGRARMLKARLAARQGEFETAAELASNAAETFDEVDDAMRAAEAELYGAIYALNAADAGAAVKNAALARSRFYHGNSPYWSGFAEIALSDVYRRVGQVGEAEKMARFAALRFDELGSGVARNRARIAEGRVVGERSPAQGKNELEIAFDRAQSGGDVVGALDSAASLVVLGATDSETAGTYGLVILRAIDRTDDPFVRERANQALALLCSRGLPDAVGEAPRATPVDIANARIACNVADDQEPSDTMVSALVAQGYSALAAGDVEEARSLAARARDSVDQDLRVNAPQQAAEAVFLAAVVEHQESAVSAEQTMLEGVRLLGESVDPTRLARVYAEFADRFVARGQIWLASELFRAAMSAAGDQGQTELRRELAMRRVTVLHATGNLDEARKAATAAQPILEGAGPAASPLLARLWTYQSDILARLGRKADSELSEDKASAELEKVDGATQVEITLLATRLALGRSDLADAKSKLQRAAALEKGLESGLDSNDERTHLRARIDTLRAELALRSGDTESASRHYQDAVSQLAGLASTPEVLRAQIRALAGAAGSATSDDVVEDVIRQLEQARDTAAKKAPNLVPAAIETLGRIEIVAGRPSRALELVEQTRLNGAVPATTPTDALCLEARAAGLSGRANTADSLRQCADKSTVARKVDATLLAAFADPEMSDRQRQRVARQLDAAHGGQLEPRELQRLKLVSEIVVGAEKENDRKTTRLRSALQKADERGKADAIVDATTALVEYLVATGQGDAAVTVVDRHSKWFYEAEPESPGRLARLQTEAKVAALDPIGAFNFASRALSEIGDVSAEDEARLLLAAATNDVLLGVWQQARSRTQRAMQRARTARERGLQRRVRDFAERFSLPLSD
jgi:hypothetical protein